jgi:hypothetical protein
MADEVFERVYRSGRIGIVGQPQVAKRPERGDAQEGFFACSIFCEKVHYC